MIEKAMQEAGEQPVAPSGKDKPATAKKEHKKKE